jgi:hypothetical protein
MSELITFRSLQKLRFFLAAVFPFLARGPRLGETPSRWLERHPRLLKWWTRVRESALASNLRRVATTFAIGNYAEKQLDWAKIPVESGAVLRAVILVATLLCVLVPVAMWFPWPALPHDTITGSSGPPVAGWSVWLWMIAAAIGWSCLLAGTAAASRVAFLPALVLFVYFGIVTVAALPKTWWSLLLVAQAALAVAFCEARAQRVRRWDVAAGLGTAILGGIITAFAAIVATPMTAWFRGHLPLAVIVAGVPLGALLYWLGGRRSHTDDIETPRPPARVDVAVATLSATHLLLLVTLVARGGLVAPAQGIAAFAIQMTGYLWPLYYFFGIGVVFKILRQTKTIHSAAVELVPARGLVPLALSFLVVATIIGWSEAVVARPAFPWPLWLGAAAGWVYGASTWLWARPLAGFTMQPMKWVFLAALAIALWALFRRRLNSGVAAGLLFIVMLLWLGVFEYYFELTGFARSPQHTAFGLLIFSVFVLWLTHRTLLDFLTSSSPWWPQSARIAIYGAGLLFVLMPLHARAALHDATLPNEIFLYLFFGVIDLGLPYYLYVYASRRFEQLPLSVPQMLGLFGIGALLSVPLIVLDKLASANWSVAAMWARATAQAAGLLQGTPLPPEHVFLPTGWIMARGALVIGALLAVAVMTRRLVRDVRLAPAATIFSVIAVASGLASFSNHSVELPLLPLRVGQLIAPLIRSLSIDASLIARHLSYLLPALLLGLVLSGRGRWQQWSGVAAAFALHVGIGLLWPSHEAWLRSTGALALAGIAGVATFLWLGGALRDRLDQLLEPHAFDAKASIASTRLLVAPELRLACFSVLFALGVALGYRAYARRLVPHAIAINSAAARFPADWRPATSADAPAPLVLTAASYSGTPSQLWADVRPYEPGATRTLLQNVAMETAQRLPEFTPTKLEPWDQYYPGSLALEFHYAPAPGDTTTWILGTTALAPLPNGEALVLTVLYALGDAERRWDLARALLALPRSSAPVLGTSPR